MADYSEDLQLLKRGVRAWNQARAKEPILFRSFTTFCGDTVERPRHHLMGANLRGANLRRGNFTEVDFYGADLRGADLRRADLARANLGSANLRGADLRDTILSGATLMGADIRESRLENANLDGASATSSTLGVRACARFLRVKHPSVEGSLQGRICMPLICETPT